jgi:hypothetical protein
LDTLTTKSDGAERTEHPVQRSIIEYLERIGAGTPTSVQLVTIAAREAESARRGVDATNIDLQTLESEIRREHLVELARAGVIEYDVQSGELTLSTDRVRQGGD